MAGETIEKLVIQIQADIAKAQHDLNKVKGSLGDVGDEAAVAGNKVQTSGQKINAVLASMKIYAVAAAAALGAIGVKAIQIAGDAVEIENKFEAVFKNTSDSARRWAEDFSDTVGRSTLETLQYLSTFQDTFVPLGFDRTEAALLSEQLTELSVDLASFNNMADTETITALQSALVGNHETMRRYGVIITQTTLDQELMNMGIEKGIQGATEQEKVMARLNIIMNSTEDAQGDAARTADEYANQMRALKGNIRDVMAEAGKEGMEDLTQTLVEFNEWGTSGGYDNITMFLSDVASLAADAAKDVAILTQTFGDLYGTFVSEGPMPEAMGTSGTMPGGNISDFVGFSDEQMTEIYRQFGYNEDEIAAKLEHRRQLIEEQNDEIDDQTDKTNQLANATSSIPDWAGHSDYIRGQISNKRSELGIEFDSGDRSTHMSIDDIVNTGVSSVPQTQQVQVTSPSIVSSQSSQSGQSSIMTERILTDILSTLQQEPRQVDVDADIEIRNHTDIKELAKKVAEILQRDITYTS